MALKTNITGHEIRAMLQQAVLSRHVYDQQFPGSLWRFEGESKPTPQEVIAGFQAADTRVAMLEDAQQRYNQAVELTAGGKKISLALAVKIVGGAGRVEKMWRTAATTKNASTSYDSKYDRTRSKTEEHAAYGIDVSEAIKGSEEAGRAAGMLRAAIASANGTEVPLSKIGVDPALFADQ